MKRHMLMAAGIAVAATTLQAQDIAPTAVAVDDYGDVATSLTGMPGDPDRGVEVMTNRGLGNCIACHQVTALEEYPFHGEVGPSLDGTGERWSEASLRGIVVNAKAVFPETVMPSFYRTEDFIRLGDGYTGRGSDQASPLLTAQQVEDVVAYLMTLTDY